MVTPPVIYDILRLLLAAGPPNPRGIDRVDLAYAQHLFRDWEGDCFGLLPTPWGLRLYDRARVLVGLERIEALWREGVPAAEDGRFADVRGFLADATSAAGPAYSAAKRAWLRRLTGPLRVLLRTGVVPGTAVRRSAPQGALYVNVGQLGWAADVMTGWLDRRPDIRAVFLLHDVIPLDHPELVSASGRWSHARMLRAVSRHASGLICTTISASERVAWTTREHNGVDPLIRALPLPIAPAFLQALPAAEAITAHPYFVVYGAIEPRKNHAVLFAAWRKLVQAQGEAAPRLVVAGSPGIGGAAVLRELLGDSGLRRHVMVVSGLRTPALRQLVVGARAVLMPSWAEGFGLPVVEALTLGTPVIASGLPAHREVGGDHAVYLPPDDADAWAAELTRFAAGGPEIAAMRASIAGYQPVTETAYFAGVRDFLLEVAMAPARPACAAPG